MRYDIEIQHLEQFAAVARTKNITRAAEELNLSQSALSRAIQKMEDQIGLPLFERKPREVLLTDMGELLLEKATEILDLVEETFSQISEAKENGRIRLGAIPTIAPYFVPSLLRSFSQHHPNISVVVQEDTTDTLIKDCQRGEIDLALLALPIHSSSVAYEPLFDEDLWLVVPSDHELATCDRVTAHHIEAHPFVTLNEAHCLSDNIATYCQQQSVRPVSVERTSQLATVQELVALDHGISIIPEMAKRLDSSERRTYRAIAEDCPTRTIAMMWNPYRYQSKWVSLLMEHLREVAKTDG